MRAATRMMLLGNVGGEDWQWRQGMPGGPDNNPGYGGGIRRIGYTSVSYDDDDNMPYAPKRIKAKGKVWMEDEEEEDGFDQQKAMEWVYKMRNADGSIGPHWKPEQVESIRVSLCPDCDKWEFYAAMNMMYSDYCTELKKYGVDKPEVYAGLAKAFLKDEDAKPDKLEKYKKHIAR